MLLFDCSNRKQLMYHTTEACLDSSPLLEFCLANLFFFLWSGLDSIIISSSSYVGSQFKWSFWRKKGIKHIVDFHVKSHLVWPWNKNIFIQYFLCCSVYWGEFNINSWTTIVYNKKISIYQSFINISLPKLFR